jgi:hypothetical protein
VNTAALRTLIIYGIILPLAVFIGYVVAGDLSYSSFGLLAAIGLILLLPALLKWHYAALVFSLNSSVTIFFLPGQPTLWMLMGGINFGLAVLYRVMQKRRAFISAPSITIPLLAILAVVIITGKLRGGFSSMALGGSSYGGKGYYFIIGAIIAYFGLISQPIPVERAKHYVALFFLPIVVFSLGSTLIYFAGPSFYFLYLLFPVGFASFQAESETAGSVVRFAGIGSAAAAIANYLLATGGIRGVIRNWWRLIVLILALLAGTLAGFRSVLLLFLVVFMILFVMEGLLRSPLFPALIVVMIIGFVVVSPFASKLPRAMQRTLSFLPLDIDPFVRSDAEGSVAWRVEMWRAMLPELPKYIWIGKGYSISPTDLYLAQQAALRGRAAAHEAALAAGDYHSGPLSLYVPFGSFGVLAFLAFLTAGLRATLLNYRYGNPGLRNINRFLFAYFVTKVIFFFGVFGGFYGDMPQLTGLLGLCIALNGGICRKPEVVQRPVVFRGSLRLKSA